MRLVQVFLVGASLLLATAAHAQAPETPPAAPAPAATAAPAAAPALRRYPATSFGLGLGWGAPYGWGVDLSHLVTGHLDLTAGAGFTITGGKLGVGTRYYFAPERRLSTFVGANLVHSTGFDRVTVTTTSGSTNGGSSYYNTPDNNAVVKYTAANLLHLRGGIRWQPLRRFAMLGGLGYGIVLSGGATEYVSGDYSPAARDTAKLLAPGGVELSFGIAFGLY